MRSHRRRPRAGLPVLLLPLLLVGAAGPRDTVQQTLTQAQGVIESSKPRLQKVRSLHDIARELLDTQTMGRRAMGRVLLEQTPEQQEEFLRLFDDLMVRHYLQRLLLFRQPRFAFPKETLDGERATVGTKILTARDEYSVDYEMRRIGGRWQATDIVVEGISQTKNYHSQFRRLLRSLSFEQILNRIRRKVDVLAEREAG